MQPQPQQPKTITHGDGAKEKALSGTRKMYIAVSSTLGPRSRNVAIKRQFGAPSVVHDGKSVARACLPMEDQEEDTAAEILYGAAERTDSIGDGTTTATILGYKMFEGAHKLITAGARVMALREGMELAAEATLQQLQGMAKPIKAQGKKKGEISQEVLMVATISAQNIEIGQMVADAYAALGKDGILTVEEGTGESSSLDVKTGMEVDRGWITPHFITPGNNLDEATINDANILITDHNLEDTSEVARMLHRLVDNPGPDGKPLPGGIRNIVIIAASVSTPVLAFLLKNHLESPVKFNVVLAPSFGDKRQALLEDIAVMTGGALVSEATGVGLQSVTKEMLGRAKRVTSTKDTTVIVEGAGDAGVIKRRIADTREKAQNSDLSAFDREKLLERVARMGSGVGVLTIGARNESELKERRERAVDAVSAARAALSEGILPGGGMALIAASRAAQASLEGKMKDADADIRSGAKLVFDSCYAPFRKLMENSGFDPGQMLARLEGQKVGTGIDVMDGQVVDMIEAGIIDPVAVVRAALANATSVAGTLATSDTYITDKPLKMELHREV